MVNKKLLEIGDRLGMKYPQIEMLNNEFRRDFRFLIFMLFMAGVIFYMNVVGQKAPQVLSMADLGYTEEVVESKQVNTDGRNDQRYRLSLNGWDDGAKIRIHINLEIIDFAEENDPIAGFARESGLPCSAKSCSLAALEGLVILDADVWNADFAAAKLNPDTDPPLQTDYRNTIYLLKSNRMISFSYDQPIAFTEAKRRVITAMFAERNLFDH